jgi:hypothetical protein
VNGAILNSFVSSGVFKGTPPSVEDVIFADDTYFELERLKKRAEELLAGAGSALVEPAKREKVELVRKNVSRYNFYDAAQIAEEALAGTKRR